MKPLNDKGIALVTALMLTLITLAMILSVLFVIANNSKASGKNKAYRNVTEAAYGGADLLAQDIIPRLFTDQNTTNLSGDYNAGIGLLFKSGNACLQQKLNNPTSSWTTAVCGAASTSLDAKVNPDITFSLTGVAGNYVVNSKIIDTIPGVQYPPTPPGGPLIGGGVAQGSEGTTTNLNHYVYRIEISGERTTNASEKSNISVLYEY